MPNQDRDWTYGWNGWRPRRRRHPRRIGPSRDFDKFLIGELDSSEYARLLMRPRKTAGIEVRVKPQGPIAKAQEEAMVKGDRVHPIGTSATARVAPEYFRFLREEISSLEYAKALTDCAKLEGLYRAPTARFSFPKRGLAEVLVDALRFLFVAAGLAIAILGVLPVVAPLGAKLAASVMQWAWTMSAVGAALLAFTFAARFSSALVGTIQSLQRVVSARFAHEGLHRTQ